MIEKELNPMFVEILDRSVFYSMSEFDIIKIACSKYSTIEELKQISRKERKDRKIISKKSKPKYKNQTTQKIRIPSISFS